MVDLPIPDIATLVTQMVLIAGLIFGAVKWLDDKTEKKGS